MLQRSTEIILDPTKYKITGRTGEYLDITYEGVINTFNAKVTFGTAPEETKENVDWRPLPDTNIYRVLTSVRPCLLCREINAPRPIKCLIIGSGNTSITKVEQIRVFV